MNSYILFWHERRRCSRSTFGRPTGNDVSGPLFPLFYSCFLFSVVCFSPTTALQMKKVSLAKVDWSGPKPKKLLFSYPQTPPNPLRWEDGW